MNNVENIVKQITQKDDNIAINVMTSMFNDADLVVFNSLNDKSEFLFEFVKKNVARRFQSVIKASNYQNLFKFFTVYSYDYFDVFVDCFLKFATDIDFDKLLELSKNGTDEEKTYAIKILGCANKLSADVAFENAFSDFEPLMTVCVDVLKTGDNKECFNKALDMLKSEDDFEVLNAVKFLVAYGDKSVLPQIYEIMKTSPVSAGIADEIPFLSSLLEMLKSDNISLGLFCLSEILDDLAENIPLSYIFNYELYDVLNFLIQKNLNNNKNFSEIAMDLVKAKVKFELITSNDEYIFDADKDTKNEVFEILNLLRNQDEKFWQCQTEMITDELYSYSKRVLSVLELIRELNLKSAADDVMNLLDNDDETVVCSAVHTLNLLGAMSSVDKKIVDNFKNENLKILVSSYFN